MKLWKFSVLLLIFSKISAYASCESNSHHFYIGPEVYHAERTKAGGSKQNGWLYGAHFLYERKKHNGIYWALDSYYARGSLKGKTAQDKPLRSTIIDREIEGRIGYGLHFNVLKNCLIIPFGGYGDFHSKNCFKTPSPLTYESNKIFNYFTAGVEAAFQPHSCFKCGFNYRVKFMIDAKNKIKDDPGFDRFSLNIGHKKQYEWDLIFQYLRSAECKKIDISLIPFYRFRHYGGNVNWPFDFIETKYRIYGVRVLLNLSF